MLLVFVVSLGSEGKIKKMQRGRGKIKICVVYLLINSFIHLFIFYLLYTFIFRVGGRLGRGESEDYGQIRPRLAFGLPGKVRFTILPLQRIEGHMQAIKIISIGRHK